MTWLDPLSHLCILMYCSFSALFPSAAQVSSHCPKTVWVTINQQPPVCVYTSTWWWAARVSCGAGQSLCFESGAVMMLAPHDRKHKTIKVKWLLCRRSQHMGKHYMCIPEQLHCFLEGLLKHATLFLIPIQGRSPLEACASLCACPLDSRSPAMIYNDNTTPSVNEDVLYI